MWNNYKVRCILEYYNTSNSFLDKTITESRSYIFRGLFSYLVLYIRFQIKRRDSTSVVLRKVPLWLCTSRVMSTSCMEFICYGREIINYIIAFQTLKHHEKFDLHPTYLFRGIYLCFLQSCHRSIQFYITIFLEKHPI